MKRAIFNWSGGKDSSLALYYVLKSQDFDIQTLLTSVNTKYQRISMHGVRVDLLEEQAQSLNIPLHKLEVPEMPSMATYNRVMRDTLKPFKANAVDYSIFGDIFLEDLKQYREEQLAQIGMKASFPIWKRATPALIKEFLDLGFKAITVCVNDQFLDRSFVGRTIDEQFVNDLPGNVDPCGENGEFHSFVYDGPIFEQPIAFQTGEVVYKEYKPCAKEQREAKEANQYKGHDDVFSNGFWYCDLISKRSE